jgi:uncharacterized protein YdeI (YjbR/CyaY-like superfamily)
MKESMISSVDKYILDGCGRCDYFETDKCKVRSWQKEIKLLREIVLETELNEEIKWGVPCYTFNKKNIIIVSAFKEYCSIAFFKGALMKDPQKLLVKPGASSQSSMLIKFYNSEDITKIKEIIQEYIFEAIQIEISGKKIETIKNPEPIPDELLTYFDKNPNLKKAFFALTPGRQRGYIIYFSQPKQSKSRESRILKSIDKILNGEGLNDKYK